MGSGTRGKYNRAATQRGRKMKRRGSGSSYQGGNNTQQVSNQQTENTSQPRNLPNGSSAPFQKGTYTSWTPLEDWHPI